MASEPPLSYYAVFDGHAGKDAAAFAASHLHTVSPGYWDQFWREIQIQLLSFLLQRIVGNVNYPKDPVAAIRGAFEDTDLTFLEKGQSEVGHLQAGMGW